MMDFHSEGSNTVVQLSVEEKEDGKHSTESFMQEQRLLVKTLSQTHSSAEVF